jgi:hypothetical protein
LRPFCIQDVFVFDANRLHLDLSDRGVKIGIATSVRNVQWETAEVFPRANNPLLVLSPSQRRQLEIFACEETRLGLQGNYNAEVPEGP